MSLTDMIELRYVKEEEMCFIEQRRSKQHVEQFKQRCNRTVAYLQTELLTLQNLSYEPF